jgi:hypothetical protein
MNHEELQLIELEKCKDYVAAHCSLSTFKANKIIKEAILNQLIKPYYYNKKLNIIALKQNDLQMIIDSANK